MKLRQIDKALYRSKQRKVALVFCSIFLVLGMSFAALLRDYAGNPEGSNMAVNLAGVIIGLVITGGIYAAVVSKPFFDEIRYAWNLKRQVLKIQNKKHIWKDKLEQGDQTAATVLAFYYAGVTQLQFLENNEFGQKEMEDECAEFEGRCAKHNLTHNAENFSIDLLL